MSSALPGPFWRREDVAIEDHETKTVAATLCPTKLDVSIPCFCTREHNWNDRCPTIPINSPSLRSSDRPDGKKPVISTRSFDDKNWFLFIILEWNNNNIKKNQTHIFHPVPIQRVEVSSPLLPSIIRPIIHESELGDVMVAHIYTQYLLIKKLYVDSCKKPCGQITVIYNREGSIKYGAKTQNAIHLCNLR